MLDFWSPLNLDTYYICTSQRICKQLAAFARSWNMHGLQSEHHLTSLPLWMRSMATRQIVHLSDLFHSLQDAATAHDRPPEFYLNESDLCCFFSLPHATQRICVKCKHSDEHQPVIHFVPNPSVIMNLLCKSVEAKQVKHFQLHEFFVIGFSCQLSVQMR